MLTQQVQPQQPQCERQCGELVGGASVETAAAAAVAGAAAVVEAAAAAVTTAAAVVAAAEASVCNGIIALPTVIQYLPNTSR